jgi:PAS domain S-box-containing protein
MPEKPTYEQLQQKVEALEAGNAGEDHAFISAVLDNIGEAIVTCDADGQLIRFNEAARILHGLPENPIPPHQWAAYYDLYQTDGVTPLSMAEVPLYRALQGERVRNAEIVVVPKNSDPHYLVCNGQALIDARGRRIGAVIAMHDLTRRKQAEDRLRESESRFQRMLSMVPDMISVHSPQMDILYSNWTGFAAVPESDRILHTKCYHTYRGFDDICPDCRAKSVLETGKAMQSETRLPDGTWVDLRVLPIFDQDQNIEMFMEWVRDITERKRVEEDLRESEEKYRGLFESLVDGVAESDLEGRILSCNPAYLRMTGHSEKEIRKLRYRDLTPDKWHATDAYHVKQTLERGYSDLYEKERLRKDGTTIPISMRIWLKTDKHGRPAGFWGIIRDVSDRFHAQQEREKLQHQLHQAQKMESIGRLAGGVAHDLNNLLSPILGYSEMLLEDLPGTDPRKGQMQEIVRAGSRAQDLVRQLLAFCRKQPLQFQAMDINALLQDFEKLLRRTLREDITLQRELDPSLPHIQGDTGQLEQVIMNLAVNAQDAMPQGGALSIKTAAMELDGSAAKEKGDLAAGPYVMLAMSDTGTGMDANTIDHMFEPFFTTKEKGKGTGLGMATAYGIIKQHGGSIRVYSEPGIGTTIKIYLPAATGSMEERAVRPPAHPAAKGSETVLLAEDDQQVRDLAAIALERYGYKVFAAANGGDAQAIAEGLEGPIHLLLTDVIMPDMNGKELFEQISRSHPEVRVLFMSGYTDDVIAHHGGIDAGIPFIGKPFNLKGLAEKVRFVLDG